jgi:raffinose/stachyose/melibiose transport system permease protein
VEGSAAAPAGPSPPARAWRLGGLASIAVFMAPTLLVYVGLTAYPVLRTLANSLLTIKPRGVEEFVGLANYAELWRDGTFWTAVGNTLIWAGVAPVLDVGVGLLLALCLYARVPFARFFRVAWFTPALISYVVVAIVWTWIYNYDWGAANELLAWIGLGRWRTAWIGQPATALWALILVDVWKWAGFNMIVCLAALHSLPSEVVEAAELDRCGWMAKLVFIAVPMIRTTLTGLLILGFIGKMKVFDLVWIMTRGGPLWSTETVSTYVYKRAFDWNTFDLGYPSALASVWFAVVLAGVMALSRVLRPRERLEY